MLAGDCWWQTGIGSTLELAATHQDEPGVVPGIHSPLQTSSTLGESWSSSWLHLNHSVLFKSHKNLRQPATSFFIFFALGLPSPFRTATCISSIRQQDRVIDHGCIFGSYLLHVPRSLDDVGLSCPSLKPFLSLPSNQLPNHVDNIETISRCFFCSSPIPPTATTNTSACRTTKTLGAFNLVPHCVWFGLAPGIVVCSVSRHPPIRWLGFSNRPVCIEKRPVDPRNRHSASESTRFDHQILSVYLPPYVVHTALSLVLVREYVLYERPNLCLKRRPICLGAHDREHAAPCTRRPIDQNHCSWHQRVSRTEPTANPSHRRVSQPN